MADLNNIMTKSKWYKYENIDIKKKKTKENKTILECQYILRAHDLLECIITKVKKK